MIGREWRRRRFGIVPDYSGWNHPEDVPAEAKRRDFQAGTADHTQFHPGAPYLRLFPKPELAGSRSAATRSGPEGLHQLSLANRIIAERPASGSPKPRFLSRMERTRHQLAPAMPSEKSVDRAGAGAGAVADRLLVGLLEIVDVQHLTGAGGFGKARQQRFLLRYRPVLALASAARLRPERFEPAPGVKDGRHSDGTACSNASRPLLDRREHGGTLDPFGLKTRRREWYASSKGRFALQYVTGTDRLR
jgi:hypothetical protein